MWLLTLLLALMASSSACPDLCECHPTDRLVTCMGKSSSPTELLLSPHADVKHLSLSGSDELDVTSFLMKFENGSSALPRLESLLLTNCSLYMLNVSWLGFDSLRELNLSCNNLADVRHAAVDDGFANLANLTMLDMSNNFIDVVGAETFRTLTNLVWLKMRSNIISKIDENAFSGLSNLENLDLSNNRFNTLPSGALTPLNSLQKLDLSGNKLQVLGARWFESLTRLRELDVSRNGLARAASGVLQPLPGLSVLRLAENPLKERDLSLLLGTGRRLETVDASRTGLVRVPAALTRSVRALRLAGNKLMSIRSGDFDSYPLLRLLDISANRLTDVEEDALGRLEVLQELDISENILSTVPRSLPNSLQMLNLASNAIAIIKFNDLQGLYNLQNLTFKDNAISMIEEGSLSQLPALRKLDISNNPIKVLPTNTLNGPNNLAILHMSGLSQLEERSEEGDMAFPVPTPERLVILDISHSPVLAAQLLTDDAALSACKSLLVLNLAYTNVTMIRSDLSYFIPQLHSLGLSGNDWNCSEEQYWLGQWLRQHVELEPRAQCVSPDELAGHYLQEMPSPPTIPTSTLTSTNLSVGEERSTTSRSIENRTITYIAPNPSASSSYGFSIITSSQLVDDREKSISEPSVHTTTLISRKVENAIRDTNGISTVSDFQDAKPTILLPTQHSTQGTFKVMRPYSRLGNAVIVPQHQINTPTANVNNRQTNSTENPMQNDSRIINKLMDRIQRGKMNKTTESRTESKNASSFQTFNKVFLKTTKLTNVTQAKSTNVVSDILLNNSIMSNDITKTIAEELNGQVTDSGSRLTEPLSAGAHPGMLVLAGAALGAAAVLTVVLSRRATRRTHDKYHRHENIEVHSLTPTTELW